MPDELDYQTISVPFGARITVEFPDGDPLEDGEEPRLMSLSWVAGPPVSVDLDRSSSGEQSPPPSPPGSAG